MSIQERKTGADSQTPVSKHEFFGPTEQNRQVLRNAIFAETGDYPAIQKAKSILDGDYNYNSEALKYVNRGS
jgi:hypothetical protein